MNSGGYTTSLPFGLQWDLIMKYLEVKNAATSAELAVDSKSWGNYSDSEFSITNADVKYTADAVTWLTAEETLEKAADDVVILSTGARDEFSKMNIYDLAGNLFEWTLEYDSANSNPCWFRGGNCVITGSDYPAFSSLFDEATVSGPTIGFRPSLY